MYGYRVILYESKISAVLTDVSSLSSVGFSVGASVAVFVGFSVGASVKASLTAMLSTAVASLFLLRK